MTPIVGLAIVGASAMGVLIWWSFRYAWWRPALPWSRPRVLMYHMVRAPIPGARFNKLRVRPSRFEQQVAWLEKRGFAFSFASQIHDAASSNPVVCLTFDDGYADNLLAADPVLERHNACATLYLVEDRSGGWSSQKKAHHADDELADEPKLTDDQVRALLATGRWELGGHTRTHALLTDQAPDAARDEIAGARTRFAEEFGVTPSTFAYPFGIFHDSHAAMAREAGYIAAFTTEAGVPAPGADPMRMPRVKISGKDGMLAFRLRLRTGRRGWRK